MGDPSKNSKLIQNPFFIQRSYRPHTNFIQGSYISHTQYKSHTKLIFHTENIQTSFKLNFKVIQIS